MTKLTRHHLYWPKAAYKHSTEKFFRQLPCNIILIGEDEHREVHFGPPPNKPSRGEMLDKIGEFNQGQCGCLHHSKRSYGIIYIPSLVEEILATTRGRRGKCRRRSSA